MCPSRATFRLCLAGIVNLVLALAAWANFAPRFWGDAAGEPWGLKNVAISQERLTVDLRPLVDKNPVRVEVTCSEAVLAGRPGVRVAVRDNGPGLNPEQRRRIFEPFYTTKTKGTGLGMAIAKRIVDAHGGRIALADGPGPGAEILLTLPRSKP